MNTTENNKLIAEFMGTLKKMYKDNFGGQVYYNPADENDRHSEMYTNQFKYHTSWDWLMPVVEKIEEEDYCIDITKEGCDIRETSSSAKCISSCERSQCDFKIEATYKAVAEFIKWYNENKN